jgi:hypothetical protein
MTRAHHSVYVHFLEDDMPGEPRRASMGVPSTIARLATAAPTEENGSGMRFDLRRAVREIDQWARAHWILTVAMIVGVLIAWLT